MGEDLLYQDLILEHARKTENTGELGQDAVQVSLQNPLCGDKLKLFVKFKGKNVSDIKFMGDGCLISRASASILSELVKGKNREEIQELVTLFENVMQRNDQITEKLPGDLEALRGVSKFPARRRCALLVFEAMRMVLEQS